MNRSDERPKYVLYQENKVRDAVRSGTQTFDSLGQSATRDTTGSIETMAGSLVQSIDESEDVGVLNVSTNGRVSPSVNTFRVQAFRADQTHLYVPSPMTESSKYSFGSLLSQQFNNGASNFFLSGPETPTDDSCFCLATSTSRYESSSWSSPKSDTTSDVLSLWDPVSNDIPFRMRPTYIASTMMVAFLLGIPLQESKHTLEIGYWVDTVGQLILHALHCVTLPLAFFQVIIFTTKLSSTGQFWSLWGKIVKNFMSICILSISVAMAVAYIFNAFFEQHEDVGNRLEHPDLAFKCSNHKYLQFNETNNALYCSGLAIENSTTFPWLVDVNDMLGFEEPVGRVDISGYLFAVLDIYFPHNIISVFSRNLALSVLIIGTTLGCSIQKTFSRKPQEKNSLLLLMMHIYQTFSVISQWLHTFIFVAIFPLLIGPMMTDPEAKKVLQFGLNYCIAFTIAAIVQVVVIVPSYFYYQTKENPYDYIWYTLPAALHSWIFQSSFLSLSVAINTTKQLQDTPIAVFGSIYPVVSAINQSSSALGLPSALIWAAKFTGCNLNINLYDACIVFIMCLVASLGVTSLPRSRLALFLTLWRNTCTNVDTPSAILAITGVQFITFRLTAFCNTITNMMLVRMIVYSNNNAGGSTSI